MCNYHLDITTLRSILTRSGSTLLGLNNGRNSLYFLVPFLYSIKSNSYTMVLSK